MRAFLEEYGIAIFLVAIIVVLVVMATPLGKILGNILNELIDALTRKFNTEVSNSNRPGVA